MDFIVIGVIALIAAALVVHGVFAERRRSGHHSRRHKHRRKRRTHVPETPPARSED